MKQKLALVIAFAFILCSFPVYAAETSNLDLTDEVAEAMVELAGVECAENSVVTMTDDYVSVTQATPSGDFATTFISSYADSSGDDLSPVNPKELTDEVEESIANNPLARSSSGYQVHLEVSSSIDVYVTVTVIYSRYTHTIGTNIHYFYRPYGVQASWTSTSSVSVTSMTAEYDTNGTKIVFPDCIQVTSEAALQALSATPFSAHKVTLTKASPTKGTAYVSYNYMESDKAMWLETGVEESFVTASIVVSGKTYEYGYSIGNTY